MIDLAQAKRHINETSTTYDAEIQDHLDVAVAVVEEIIDGPVGQRTITAEIHHPDSGRIWLYKTPVISVSSITSVYGYTATYTVSNYTVDSLSGEVIPNYGVSTFTYPVAVTYVAGRTSSDPRIDRAVLDLFRINWRPQQGGNYSAFDEAVAAGEGSFRLGYFVPRNLEEGLLRAFNVPRFA